MSRFAARKPFHPSGAFVAIRGFTFNGEEIKPGDPVDIAAIGGRRAEQLYDQKRIDYAPDGVERAAKASSAPAQADAGSEPEKPSSATDNEPEAHLYKAKYSGFGGWKVFAPDGSVAADGLESKAAAEAKAAELNATLSAG